MFKPAVRPPGPRDLKMTHSTAHLEKIRMAEGPIGPYCKVGYKQKDLYKISRGWAAIPDIHLDLDLDPKMIYLPHLRNARHPRRPSPPGQDVIDARRPPDLRGRAEGLGPVHTQPVHTQPVHTQPDPWAESYFTCSLPREADFTPT